MTAPAVCNPPATLRLMKVAVRLFAGLRELAGTRHRELELPEGATAADVWPALGLGDEPPGLLLAVNKSYAPRDSVLADGDEVALIPPVSGGAFRLSERAALPRRCRPRGRIRRRGRDRDVHGDDAGPLARP